MKNIGRTKTLSWLLVLAMILSLVPIASLTAYAKSEVKYLDASGTEQSITNYTVVDYSTTTLRRDWYVVNSDVEINQTNGISVSGDVNLILCDGAKFTVTCSRDGISAARGSLTIYAQSTSDNMGELEVTSTDAAGIRLLKNLTINGGKIEIQGSNGIICQNADITINGGNVTADGGIFFSTPNNLTITGGKVIASATGTDSGIYTEGEVIISGGNVSVTGDENPAIDGTVKNSIAGTGWTNKAGTEGKADIAISTGQTLSYKKVQFPAAASHTHNFTYSSDGAVITATCSASGCTLTDNKATLTIAAPELTTYGETGKSEAASLTGLTDFNTATGKTIAETDIKYVGRDGTTYAESATAPTGAGKYTAKITVEEKTASVDYEIAKVDPTYTVPTGLTATYGQALASVTLPTGWAWADGTQSVGNVGTNTFKVNFTPADTANYNTVSGVDVTVTVGKAAGKDAVISTDTMAYNADSIYIEGVAGQEYVIVPKGTAVTDADWNTSVKPDPERENWVFFENLNEATEYEIYTRTAETETAFASDAVKANVYTTLSSIGYLYDSTLVGASITVEPESDVEGLTYKWYQDEVTEDGEGIFHHNLTEIPGATGSTYTFRTEDAGKNIAVKIFAGDSEVGDFATDAPVALTAKVIFESNGGSDVETLTDVAYQSKIKAPADPTREGFAFDGWYWDEEFETPFDFEKDVITWTETTLYAKWTPNDYKITSVTGLTGTNNKQWTKGGKDAVVITVEVSGEDNSFDHFTGVKLDDVELVKDVDYTVEKGSTVVTLKPETLEQLSVGEHTVTILFNNGEANTTLTVLAASGGNATSPQTGDNSHLGLWIALMMLSLIGIAASLIFGKKKRVYYK